MQIRQGDVFIEPANIPVTAKRETPERIILAHGEVTGHCHEVEEIERVELYSENGLMYLRVFEDVPLVHQEHSTIVIPPGDYQVVRQREYTPERIITVAD